jgi:S-adenosylmethionine synthetase
MGVRVGERVKITIACAFVDKFVKDIDDYVEKRENVRRTALDVAKKFTVREVEVDINTGDDIENQNVYITVTGTSAEAGDDGEVGRGNRVNGLITPYRPMSLEAAAGKNPITHVGKLYNITANDIAKSVTEEIPEIEEAYVYMVSQIGKPINQPLAVDVKVRSAENLEAFRPKIEVIVNENLSRMSEIWKRLINGEITVY